MSEESNLATQHYLAEAAHLLYRDAPETSALLSHRRIQLAEQRPDSATNPDIERQRACVACGQIFVLGVDSSLQLKGATRPKRTKSRASIPESQASGVCKEITCGRCHQVTRIQLAPPKRVYRIPVKTNESTKAKTRPSETIYEKQEELPKASANAVSKKRAKNRKGGLQALLSSQPKPAKSLSLSDFIK
ncbi:hypothetical protein VHEMI07263 [[Torrubiella] hemipterigena]|uniref:Uncharacterized protein n=1 Tax=[Torrubiella] hemipterigena TaxID=1531966 RepID=A0A0A1T2Y3_9HYPO|nr:hypothetical protein VHEMI07263 [[Torrubiella] hemipterigena]